MDAVVQSLAERIRTAAAARTPLRIRGGGTKDFLGNDSAGALLATGDVAGIVGYEPSELVVTARAGTPLAEVESLLARHGQLLPFEPPHFGANATVGGCIAAGLAGPRRMSFGVTHGGVRDSVLGARLLDGRGELLSFGGTVIKNVAGYDVSRVLAGSMGILGVIIEASLKVLPAPAAEQSLRFELSEDGALARLGEWGRLPLPISASVWHAGVLTLRLSGAAAAVVAARQRLGGESLADAGCWEELREQRLPYFAGDAPLWRLSLPATAPPLGLEGQQLIEWGGAQRWLRSSLPPSAIRARAQALGGHATLFRGGDRSAGAFTPLTPALAAIHRRLKDEFDPAGIFNPGRMYAGL